MEKNTRGKGKGVSSHANWRGKTIAGFNCLVPAEKASLKRHFQLLPSIAQHWERANWHILRDSMTCVSLLGTPGLTTPRKPAPTVTAWSLGCHSRSWQPWEEQHGVTGEVRNWGGTRGAPRHRSVQHGFGVHPAWCAPVTCKWSGEESSWAAHQPLSLTWDAACVHQGPPFNLKLLSAS